MAAGALGGLVFGYQQGGIGGGILGLLLGVPAGGITLGILVLWIVRLAPLAILIAIGLALLFLIAKLWGVRP